MINLSGVKDMGSVQVWTKVIKFAALAFMPAKGLFFISTANFTPGNVSGESAINAIGGGMAIALRSSCSCPSPSVASGCGQKPAPAP